MLKHWWVYTPQCWYQTDRMGRGIISQFGEHNSFNKSSRRVSHCVVFFIIHESLCNYESWILVMICSPPFRVGLLEFKWHPLPPSPSPPQSPIYPTDSAPESRVSLQSSPLYTRQIQPQSPECPSSSPPYLPDRFSPIINTMSCFWIGTMSCVLNKNNVLCVNRNNVLRLNENNVLCLTKNND